MRYGQHAHGQFHPAVRACSRSNAIDIGAHRRLTDAHYRCDLFIAHAAQQIFNDLCLLGRKVESPEDRFPMGSGERQWWNVFEMF